MADGDISLRRVDVIEMDNETSDHIKFDVGQTRRRRRVVLLMFICQVYCRVLTQSYNQL